MVNEEESRQLARTVYTRMPEDMRTLFMEAAWRATEEYCKETGEEFTVELAGEVAALTFRRIVGDSVSRFEEAATDEEMGRILDEEYDRLATDEGVDEKVFMEAVKRRMIEEHSHLWSPRRPPAP